jgi:hypothetical protein
MRRILMKYFSAALLLWLSEYAFDFLPLNIPLA